MTDLITSIPAEHTAAILSQESVHYSGMIQDTNKKWESLPFDAPGGLYQMAYRAIDGKWYRVNWIEFA